MIRMLLADDQALVRGALAALLGLELDIEVVAQVGSGEEVVAAARRHNPDVALLGTVAFALLTLVATEDHGLKGEAESLVSPKRYASR